eukprot:CAMPEP_0119347298 /NCGR_PEP_ID=MMETSP1333-20130426/108450_1 /TAXON_ID=418940 /ORGANISM="Scyphosphaera apsteinii, Strain RCC1455" /LENGTH=317 /DNA_ID=CAMNT_0007359835 /DNA_START=31 /DNA_END=984 /DNA_ORIENTATION=-
MTNLDTCVRLSPLVVRVLGLNPGPFTLQGTNTYLVGAGRSRILVDAGEGAAGYMETLLTALKDHGADSISDVIITHYHHDHSQGLSDLRKHFGDAFRAWKAQPDYKGPYGPSFNCKALNVQELKGDEVLTTDDGSARLRVLLTPGHTPDHICLILEEERGFFVGDCVLGGSTAVFENLRDYMASLRRLVSLTEGSAPSRLYTGHGPAVEDGAAALKEYLAHRDQREQQIVDQLKSTMKALTVRTLVAAIYPHVTNWKLKLGAANNVILHLGKLEADGKVVASHWLPSPFLKVLPGFIRLFVHSATSTYRLRHSEAER